MKKVLVLLAVAALATSCGTIGYVSTPSNYAPAGKEVSVVAKNTNILGLTAIDTQAEARQALKDLNKKCSNGVTNVTTTASAKSLSIVIFEKLEVAGNCK